MSEREPDLLPLRPVFVPANAGRHPAPAEFLEPESTRRVRGAERVPQAITARGSAAKLHCFGFTMSYRDTDHLRVLIANERRDRLALVAPIVAALGHEVIAA